MKVSIIGATGYAGAELIRLITAHPAAEILYITSESSTGQAIDQLYPHLRGLEGRLLGSMTETDKLAQSDLVFIALPHGHAMQSGKALAEANVKVIDLGADYRFSDEKVYEEWYKVSHTHPNSGAVYGLTELNREKVRTAKIVGNPGCYTTASILALAPLVKHGLIENDSIVIDAKSGVSGAGRGFSMNSHFTETWENFKAYSIAGHRHTPEIEQALSVLAGEALTLSFTPHLVPMSRGILSTCYAKLKKDVAPEKVEAAFTALYGSEYFIRLLGEGGYPATKNVRGSNFCDLGWHFDKRTGRVIVVSAIDNLVKGAAGQAVQNMNVMAGLPENTGLELVPLYP